MSHHHIIPVLTTPSGSALTAQNWQEAGVQCVSYYLSFLLVKPGMAHLKTLPDWVLYSGWKGNWVLNASMPRPSVEGRYEFRSPFDGATMQCSMNDMVEVMLHLKPTQVMLPEGFECAYEDVWQRLSTVSQLFAPALESGQYMNRPIRGLYYKIEPMQDLRAIIAKHQSAHPDLDYFFISNARHAEVAHIESDQPAKDACLGIVYCRDGEISLQDTIYATQFECIDSSCDCPTCQQQFTRAYLHHLLEHTPLLCQRYLIQHNLVYSSK